MTHEVYGYHFVRWEDTLKKKMLESYDKKPRSEYTIDPVKSWVVQEICFLLYNVENWSEIYSNILNKA